MVCYRPLEAWRGKDLNPETGKRPVVFSVSQGLADMPVSLPCGQCIGCRLEYSRQWASRIMLEASTHEFNSFVTLTYNEDNLPYPPSLDHRHIQKFLKRLRKRLPGQNLRYYMAGEYGSDTFRPHYHICLFGWDFPDKCLFSRKNDNNLYTSDFLNTLWPYGFSSVGALTFESAAYVARYVTKKINNQDKAYEYTDPETGQVFDLKREYSASSTRPAVGRDWFYKFTSDVYPADNLVIRGVLQKPPKYFDRLLEESDAKLYRQIRGDRVKVAKTHRADTTSSRLKVREKVKTSQTSTLTRSL